MKLLKETVASGIYNLGFLGYIEKLIDDTARAVIRIILPHVVSIDDKKVVFITTTGNYDCNPKAICQSLIDQEIETNIVWTTRKKTNLALNNFPSRITYANRNTYNGFRQLCSAKIIVDNSVGLGYQGYHKRKGQYLIQTWHGSIGIKKFGKDCNTDTEWLELAEEQGRDTDFIISNSEFESELYKNEFWSTATIWEFGHPRNDILFELDKTKSDALKNEIRSLYHVPNDKKICMYAPTFRDNGDLSPYKIDYERLADVLKSRFGGEWVVFTRFHRNTRKLMKSSGYIFPEICIDVNDYPDIQELMLVADVGITDYSSWICEYMLTRKPGFTFATDVNDFESTNRAFFIPLSEYPFPTSINEEQLFSNILEFDKEKYKNDCDEFLKKNGSVDDGHASERTAEKIKELLND